MSKEAKENKYKCEKCGGNLRYNPDKKGLYCDNCENLIGVEYTTDNSKHQVSKALTSANTEWGKEVKIMKCTNCGAQAELNAFDASANCPYCGTPLILDESLLPGVKPDMVIPFKFGKQRAGELFKENVKKKWFLPNKFKKQMPENEISAYYIPSFAFDADCTSKYNGELLEYYTTRDSEGRTQTHTKKIPISGNIDTKHRDTTVEASAKLNQEDLDEILPYNYSEARDFSKDYICGFPMEHYSQDVKACYDTAKGEMKGEIRSAILKKYKYDQVSYLNINTTFANELYAYNILPIYRVNYKYREKDYSNLMNGQTGQVGGKVPRSAVKITFFTIFVILLILIPVVLYFVLGGEM